jgi:ArsR family transcriptional regulator
MRKYLLRSSLIRVQKALKALSDPTRLRILTLLLDNETLCVCEVMQALEISETRASRNLGILKDAGFLKSERAGQWVHYSLNDSMDPVNRELGHLLAESLKEEEDVKRDRERLGRAVKLGRDCSAAKSQGTR